MTLGWIFLNQDANVDEASLDLIISRHGSLPGCRPTDLTLPLLSGLQLRKPQVDILTPAERPPPSSPPLQQEHMKLMSVFPEAFFWRVFKKKKHFSRGRRSEKWPAEVTWLSTCCCGLSEDERQVGTGALLLPPAWYTVLKQRTGTVSLFTLCVFVFFIDFYLPSSPTNLWVLKNKKVKQMCSSLRESILLLTPGGFDSYCCRTLQTALWLVIGVSKLLTAEVGTNYFHVWKVSSSPPPNFRGQNV